MVVLLIGAAGPRGIRGGLEIGCPPDPATEMGEILGEILGETLGEALGEILGEPSGLDLAEDDLAGGVEPPRDCFGVARDNLTAAGLERSCSVEDDFLSPCERTTLADPKLEEVRSFSLEVDLVIRL